MPAPSLFAAQDFVQKWGKVTLNEKATAQTHFNELCALLDVSAPLDIDPAGTFYRFEKPLTKAGGGAGFADVWYKNRFAWEYKSVGKYPTLQAAYQQLLLYKDDLDNPPILVACDIANYEIHVSFTNYKAVVYRFTNADLVNAETRRVLYQVMTDPEQLRPTEQTATITRQAAERFAQVAQFLEQRGFVPSQIAPFFMKLLFALFAEDIRLLPGELMSLNLKQAILKPADFPQRVKALFRAMRDGAFFGTDYVPRFNGGLFDDDDVLALTIDEIQFLADAARLDWSQVEPAIFGTLFERSLDPKKRAQLGAHYTSRDDILLIVEPVLMTPLRRAWVEVQAQVEALRLTWEQSSGSAKQKFRNQMEAPVFDFMDRLSKVRVLDPACGSGNFLYVSLNCLKDLEKEVVVYATGLGLTQPDLGVTPAQLYGIEKNQFAAELAQVVVWIGYLQWNRNNGFDELNKHEPILKTLSTIECRDAILAVDFSGQPVEPVWPEADVIVGNPPFLGTKKMRGELGLEYVEALRRVYSGRIPGFSDLVCYWFEHAREGVATGKVSRVGLLATNSIRLGENRRVLERIKETGDIFFAYADLPWILNGAAVRISMIGFDDGLDKERRLDGKIVSEIKPDLTASSFVINDVIPLVENRSIAFLGDMKGGSFDIPNDIAKEMLGNFDNPNGRPNSDVIKPTANAMDIVRKWRNYWIIDFGIDMPLEQAKLYHKPFEYVQTVVKPERDKGKPSRAEWWLHMRPGTSMRTAIAFLPRHIATPAVSKHRIFVWFTPDILSNHAVVVIARSDDYFFGVLHSRIHELWSLRMGTSLEDRPRYTPTTTFETFPFPWTPGTEPTDDPRVVAITDAARDLVAWRDAWLNPPGASEAELKTRTLTNLYNKRPDDLAALHQRLDAAVFDAYGWPHDLTDEQILERLLALNGERAAKQGAVPVVQPDDEPEE